MPLFVYNITGVPVTLAAGNPVKIIPASVAPPSRGVGIDVTKSLKGLTGPNYTALEAQRVATLVYEWSTLPEYPVGVLKIDSTLSRIYLLLTHTGLLQDGRVNTQSVFIQDLDVGYEQQNRKVAVYVPVGGSITVNASSRSLLSLEQGGIKKAVDAGLITAKMFTKPEIYTNIGRPSSLGYPQGIMIWNSDDMAPNFSDGTGNWRDSSGNIT